MNILINNAKKIRLFSLATAVCLGTATSGLALEFNKGDHVVLIGNALAERMQHHGWLESYIQATTAEKELVFRNHGFGGDKVNKFKWKSEDADERTITSCSSKLKVQRSGGSGRTR